MAVPWPRHFSTSVAPKAFREKRWPQLTNSDKRPSAIGFGSVRTPGSLRPAKMPHFYVPHLFAPSKMSSFRIGSVGRLLLCFLPTIPSTQASPHPPMVGWMDPISCGPSSRRKRIINWISKFVIHSKVTSLTHGGGAGGAWVAAVFRYCLNTRHRNRNRSSRPSFESCAAKAQDIKWLLNCRNNEKREN